MTEAPPAISILSRHGDAALREYLGLCRSCRDINVVAVHRYATAAIEYYKGEAPDGFAMTLGARWYASLAAGEPDYSVYGDDLYMGDIWACWAIYSRRYLLMMKSPKPMPGGTTLLKAIGPIRHVVDLGCGMGYTTAGLKEIFPGAEVYGTNLSGTLQFDVAVRVGKAHSFRVVPSVHGIDSDRADLIFASEYFEHIERPVEHLIDVLRRARPRALVIANAFGARSTGHFPAYRHGDAVVPNDRIGKFFGKCLRSFGYVPLKTGFWNNRPACWIYRGKPDLTASPSSRSS